MLRFIVAVAVAAMLTTSASADHHKSQDWIEKLTGVWEIDEGVNQGEKLSEEMLEGSTVVFQKSLIITYDKDRKETYRAKFSLDTSTDPVQITMVSKMEGKTEKALGIIKFEEQDEVLLCYGLPGAPRPKTFESPAGSRNMLFEIEREDDDEEEDAQE